MRIKIPLLLLIFFQTSLYSAFQTEYEYEKLKRFNVLFYITNNVQILHPPRGSYENFDWLIKNFTLQNKNSEGEITFFKLLCDEGNIKNFHHLSRIVEELKAHSDFYAFMYKNVKEHYENIIPVDEHIKRLKILLAAFTFGLPFQYTQQTFFPFYNSLTTETVLYPHFLDPLNPLFSSNFSDLLSLFINYNNKSALHLIESHFQLKWKNLSREAEYRRTIHDLYSNLLRFRLEIKRLNNDNESLREKLTFYERCFHLFQNQKSARNELNKQRFLLPEQEGSSEGGMQSYEIDLTKTDKDDPPTAAQTAPGENLLDISNLNLDGLLLEELTFRSE